MSAILINCTSLLEFKRSDLNQIPDWLINEPSRKFINCHVIIRRFQFLCTIIQMVKHLPPAIKHLLSLRNPNSHPSPPLPRLHGILSSTLADAKARKAETGWLVLAVRKALTSRPFVTYKQYPDMCPADCKPSFICWAFVSFCNPV